jgi:hypothetical protein
MAARAVEAALAKGWKAGAWEREEIRKMGSVAGSDKACCQTDFFKK